MEQFHQVLYNILVTKDLDSKFYDFMYPWFKTLTYIVFDILYYYHLMLGFIPEKSVFGRYLLFNITSIIDWRVIMAKKQQQVNIYND